MTKLLTLPQIGGFTLTASILYLSTAYHRQQRLRQSLALRQQSLVLTNVVDPLPPQPPPTAREERISIAETAKDIWNARIERAVSSVENANWSEVWLSAEDKVAAVWAKVFGTSGEETSKAGLETS